MVVLTGVGAGCLPAEAPCVARNPDSSAHLRAGLSGSGLAARASILLGASA